MNRLQEVLDILRSCREDLHRRYRVKAMGIFGSFARGRKKKPGDIDILVDFDETPDLLEFVSLERHLEEILKMRVDLVRKQALREELRERVSGEVIPV